jgi:DNA-binding CsgD family transcriptional regulator
LIMTPPICNPAWDIASLGIIVTDQTARIAWQNAIAAEVLDRGDGLISRSGIISSPHRTSAAELAAWIRQAAQAQNRFNSTGEKALRIARAARPPLLVLVSTLPAPTDGNGAASEAAAILLIAEPDRRPAILGRHLVDWFALTPTEAELAVQLADGARLEDLSARKGVRMSTLRSQLSAVLGKTGADRQAELVGLLHRLPTSRWARPWTDRRLNTPVTSGAVGHSTRRSPTSGRGNGIVGQVQTSLFPIPGHPSPPTGAYLEG